MVFPASHRVSRARWYSGSQVGGTLRFRLRDCHPLWSAFPDRSPNGCSSPGALEVAPPCLRQPPRHNGFDLTWRRFGLFPVRSPLLGESLLISLPPGTEMFHFPGFAARPYGFRPDSLGFTPAGFPHSDSSGSTPVSDSPELFAARRVLLRLLLPRHPPSALCRLNRSLRPCSKKLYVFPQVPPRKAALFRLSVPIQLSMIPDAPLRSRAPSKCVVEMSGIEPLASCVQGRRSPN